MEVYVLNTSFETVKLIDDFISLIWTDRYDEAGDFELHLAMDTDLLQYLKQDYYLWNRESEHMMIIESVSIEPNVESGNKLKITGRSLESLLDRRIIWGQKILSCPVYIGVKEILDDNFINPRDSKRKVANFIFDEDINDERITSPDIRLETQYDGESVYEVISSLCKENKIGFKITLNSKNQFVFKLYAGADRTYRQTANPYVIFSPKFDNLLNSSYLESKKDYKNVTLVGGEGEGSERKTKVVGDNNISGLDRREIYTSAGGVSSNAYEGTLADNVYQTHLKQKGIKTLAEHLETIAFEGDLEPKLMYTYGVDYFIGDIVQLANEYGHEGYAYISELVMSHETSGVSMYPTFKTIQEGDLDT